MNKPTLRELVRQSEDAVHAIRNQFQSLSFYLEQMRELLKKELQGASGAGEGKIKGD